MFGVDAEWPLAGRDEELRFVDGALRHTKGSRGVVLAGAAGVGKTRLAREALRTASRRGAVTRWAVGTTSARTLPLGAFAGVLGDSPRDATQVVRRGIEVLTAGAGRAGVVVGVDDAHLLDDLSAVLLHQLALRGTAVVVTVRTGEPAPDAVTLLWKDLRLPRLEIQTLGQPETATLVENVLGGTVDGTTVRRIWELTRGNALYLRQVVDGEVEAGRLREADGVWRWCGDLQVSPGLAELVEARMGAFPRPVRDVIDVLAVSEPLDVSLLGQVTDPAAVEDAETRGLVAIEPDGREMQARVAHPMYGEVRRARIGQLRARRLRGRIATALAGSRAEHVGDTLRRAVLLMDSDLPPDPALLLNAARSALAHFDLDLGERLARAAAEASGDFDARLTHAFALIWLARGDEAERLLSDLMTNANNEPTVAIAAAPRAGNLFWVLQRPKQAQLVLDHALARTSDEEARNTLLGIRAAVDSALGRPDAALEIGGSLLARGALSEASAVITAASVVQWAGIRGDTEAVERAAVVGYDAADGQFTTIGPVFVLGDAHVLALRLAGCMASARAVADHLRRVADEVAGPARAWSYLAIGQAELAVGRVSVAERCLREARSGVSSPHPFELRWLLLLTETLALSGQGADARAMLAELSAVENVLWGPIAPEVRLARAWVDAADGATSQAIRTAHEAAALARDMDAPAYEVLALQTVTQCGDPTGAARLAVLAEIVNGPRAPNVAAHAAALAADDGDKLLAASEALEEMGDLLAAADAAAQAVAAYTRKDQRGRAHTAVARAHRLAEACEGARTPALVAVARPLPLTEREREIITLAAHGLSNRQIAERLTVSVRTVEGHLYRATAKLGVSSRTELAALLTGD